MEMALPDGSTGVSTGACKSMYSFMEAVAGQYGVPVVSSLPVCRRAASIDPHSGGLKNVLESVLTPAGLDWLSSDGVIYVDKALDAGE
jgi:hypothetical protein